APVQSACGKSVRHQRAFSELHRRRRGDLSSIEVDSILTNLDVCPVEFGMRDIIVVELDLALGLRAIARGICADLNVILDAGIEYVPHQVEASPPKTDRRGLSIRPVHAIVAEYADQVRKVLAITGISPSLVAIPLGKLSPQPCANP